VAALEEQVGAIATLKEQVSKLATMGLRAFSEGFQRAVFQFSYFQPSMDTSQFNMNKDVVDNELVGK